MKKPKMKTVWEGPQGNKKRRYYVYVDGETYKHLSRENAMRQYNAAKRVYAKRGAKRKTNSKKKNAQKSRRRKATTRKRPWKNVEPRVLKRYKHQTGRQSAASRRRDASRTAMPPGKRLSRHNQIYYESRRNRSDRRKKKRL